MVTMMLYTLVTSMVTMALASPADQQVACLHPQPRPAAWPWTPGVPLTTSAVRGSTATRPLGTTGSARWGEAWPPGGSSHHMLQEDLEGQGSSIAIEEVDEECKEDGVECGGEGECCEGLYCMPVPDPGVWGVCNPT